MPTRELTIAGRVISDTAPAYVIAEIGNTHNGDVRLAQALTAAAARAGADAVKLQKKAIDTLYTPAVLAQPYPSSCSFGPTYGAHKHALELGREGYAAVRGIAALEGIAWFGTAFDEASVAFLVKMGAPAIKLGSGALTDAPLQIEAARTGLPLIFSTGGGTDQDIDAAVQRITKYHVHMAMLHCVAAYPCPSHELNLRCIGTLRARYPSLVIGYSGHDDGIAMSLVAYAFGARIIEKHFTLDHAAKGTDHACSLEPEGLRRLCRDLKNARVAIGTGVKTYLESERQPIAKMRRRQTAEGMKITGIADAL